MVAANRRVHEVHEGFEPAHNAAVANAVDSGTAAKNDTGASLCGEPAALRESCEQPSKPLVEILASPAANDLHRGTHFEIITF
jgi:hypothetical protein